MDKNTKIKRILEKEYQQYERYFAKTDVLKSIKKYCRENDLSIKELRKMDAEDLCDDEECVLAILDSADLQKDINFSVEAISEVGNEESQTVLYQSLKASFKAAIERQKETKITIQIIFIEHNFAPNAYLCGFGEGDYPLLTTPQYIKFDYTKEAFNGSGKVDFSTIWQFHQTQWYEKLHGIDIDFLSNIDRLYKRKTYLMLHEAMKNLVEEDFFKELKIVKPLFIYANEHDCEASNIYIFE